MPSAPGLFQRAGLRWSVEFCCATVLLVALAGCGGSERPSVQKPSSGEAAEEEKSEAPAVPGLAEMQEHLSQKKVIDDALPPPPPEDAYLQDDRVPSGSLSGLCVIPYDKKVEVPVMVPPEVLGLSSVVKAPLAGEAEFYRVLGVSLPVLLEQFEGKQYRVNQVAIRLKNVKAGALEQLTRPALLVNDGTSRIESYSPLESYWGTRVVVAFGKSAQRLEIRNGSLFPCLLDLVEVETSKKLFEVEVPAYTDKDFPGQFFRENQLLSWPQVIKTPFLQKTGVVAVTDRRRPWLKGYISVADNPYVTMSAGGRFKMDRVPVGTYEVEVFHPFYTPKKATHTVEIREKESAFLAVEFEVPAILKDPPRLPARPINEWAFLGPFSADYAKALDVEKEWDFAARYRGKNRTAVQWRRVSPAPPGMLSLVDVYGRLPSLESTSYLAAVLDAPRAQEVLFGVGASMSVKLWLNGELVHACPSYERFLANERFARGKLKAGANRLLVKLVCGERGGAFALAFDAEAAVKAPDGVIAMEKK